ncbi:hypothetical protein COLO4_14322 [Corchorus olitorius]|uniref:Uncharacterized protein n=1 Tax=Corchorus olitorius TaxID=93759 RepID=A0A1R3JST9_9ROSI|nr:hypothetical protein COLO4_14322 [Corchorus olitorius]
MAKEYAIGNGERPTGQVTKFVSGDDLEDDFMTEDSSKKYKVF